LFHLQRLGVPPEVRSTFAQVSAPAAAGFGMLGVLSSITGVLLVSELDRHEPALTGAVLFLAFASVIVGQLVDRRLPAAASLVAAGVALILSGCLVAVAVLTASLRALVAAAFLTGLGTGGGFGAGLRAIGARVPADQRGAAFSAFFVVLYPALALPAPGVGIVTERAGLRWAGSVFAALLALVTFSAIVSLRRRRLSEPG
jgi:MFS family permease